MRLFATSLVLVSAASLAALLIVYTNREEDSTKANQSSALGTDSKIGANEERRLADLMPTEASMDFGTLVAKLQVEADGQRKAELRQSLASVSDPSTKDSILALLMQHSDQEIAIGAEQALLGMMNGPLMQRLIESYGEGSDAAAQRIAHLVERVRSPDAFPVLEELLQQTERDIEDPLALAALRALAVAGTPYATAVLARRLDGAGALREEVILANALAAVSRSGTEIELLAIARGQQDANRPVTRIAAIRALQNYPMANVRAALSLLARDADSGVATAAARALGP